MSSKKSDIKPKVQSKLSFYDRLFTKPAPKVAANTKNNNNNEKTTSHKDVNDTNLILFPRNELTSDMEVDTTVSQQPESEAESSTKNTTVTKTTTIPVDEDPELTLPPINKDWSDSSIENLTKTGNLDEEALSPEFLKDAQQDTGMD